MNWGDVPAWAAIAVSLAALGRSWQAERRAREATAGAASLEVSLQRIADALDRSRVNEHRGNATASSEPRGRTIESAAPSPEFNVEFVSGHSYRLRNVSTVGATGVTVTVEDFPTGLTRELPTTVDLPPLASAGPFLIIGSWQSRAPGEVLVTCDQLPGPVRVPLPPRG
jgi:hypothetical protein